MTRFISLYLAATYTRRLNCHLVRQIIPVQGNGVLIKYRK